MAIATAINYRGKLIYTGVVDVNGEPIYSELFSGQVTPTQISVSANKTFSLEDANTFQFCTNLSPINLTIPSDSSVNFPIGQTFIDITQDSTGSITLVASSGVEIKRQGSSATTGHILIGQYAIAHLKKVASNSWRVYGGLSW